MQNLLKSKATLITRKDISRMVNWCEVCGKPFTSNGTNSTLLNDTLSTKLPLIQEIEKF